MKVHEVPSSLLRCENVAQFTDSTPSKPETLVAKPTKLSGVTVKISTTRMGCDKTPAPSGRFLTQKFDVTDCVRVQVRESPLWRKICEVNGWDADIGSNVIFTVAAAEHAAIY